MFKPIPLPYHFPILKPMLFWLYPLLLAILCDLFGMVVWLFKMWNVLQVGDQTVSFESPHSTWKWMVGIRVSSWDGPSSGAMLVLGRVLFLWNSHHIFPIFSLQFGKLEWLNYKSAAPTRGTCKSQPISTIYNIFGLFLVYSTPLRYICSKDLGSFMLNTKFQTNFLWLEAKNKSLTDDEQHSSGHCWRILFQLNHTKHIRNWGQWLTVSFSEGITPWKKTHLPPKRNERHLWPLALHAFPWRCCGCLGKQFELGWQVELRKKWDWTTWTWSQTTPRNSTYN